MLSMIPRRDSEGMLLFTNDGEFANNLTHPSAQVNKTYRVTVSGDMADEKLIKLQEGIDLDGKKTLPCDVFVIERKPDRTVLIFIIHEGRNRQIRRMCEAVGLRVQKLQRVAIGRLTLGELPLGKWRELTEDEVTYLLTASKKERN